MKDKKQPLVSAIVVNWNGKDLLAECLDSLLSQTYKALEIILVDNASSDGSVPFVREKYPDIKLVLSEKNLGFAGGNNLGIAAAKGDLILFLNTDASLESNAVGGLVYQIRQKQLDIIAPYEKRDLRVEIMRVHHNLDVLGHPVTVEAEKGQPFYLSGVCILFSKNMYLETLGLDENFFMYVEDADWFWRLKLQRKSFGYADGVFVVHKGSGSTGAGIKKNVFLWRNENTLQMLLKNYKAYNLIWILPLYLIQNAIEAVYFVLMRKPEIAMTYIGGVVFNLRYFKRTMQSRKRVQAMRLASDFEIIKGMYHGPGKLVHLLKYNRSNKGAS